MINFRSKLKPDNTAIYEGYSIETLIEKLMDAEEQIDATAPIVYTARKDGVLPQYDIRTDRWDIAQSAMEKVAQKITLRRESYDKSEDKESEKTSEIETNTNTTETE